MDLQLPPRIDGQSAGVLQNARQVTIIGANGSGKTRFAKQLLASCGDKSFRISALRAMFPSTKTEILPGSIDERFAAINAQTPEIESHAATEFERLNYVMLTEEFRDLMNYKTRRLIGEDKNLEFPRTKLDTVVKMWQEVFPQNKVLRENGKLMFSTEGQPDRYNAIRLSDGEKAVLYYIGAALYARPGGVIFVDDPETFLHPSIMRTLWNVIEDMRSDCTFVYNTHDVDFATSRIDNKCVWVKDFSPEAQAWDYEVLDSPQNLNDSVLIELLGSRKPALFIEGDEQHSIDIHLYSLIFPNYTIKPLGSCDKVIESVRSFNDLSSFHHLDSWGIVDRDRRSEPEVGYLRKRKILVPNVAEVENILMLEGVIKAVAQACRKNPDSVFDSVKRTVLKIFDHEIKAQALQHTRHRVKRDVEVRIDMKFKGITALEEHMVDLVNEINPRGIYEDLCRTFRRYVATGDYAGVLKVFNQKTMIGESNVAALCGLRSRNDYVRTVLNLLKHDGAGARQVRLAILTTLGVVPDEAGLIRVKEDAADAVN